MLGYVCVLYGGRLSGHQSSLQVPHLTSEHLNRSSPLEMGDFSTIPIDFDVVISKAYPFVQSEPDTNVYHVTNSLNNLENSRTSYFHILCFIKVLFKFRLKTHIFVVLKFRALCSWIAHYIILRYKYHFTSTEITVQQYISTYRNVFIFS
jgi:hypothetical protein